MSNWCSPKIGLKNDDLPGEWKTAHTEFIYDGPLKEKLVEKKSNYLMIWVGVKGRDVYSSLHIAKLREKRN